MLYELAYRDKLTAKEIGEALEIDQGYLSRILRSFSERGLITRVPSPADRRNSLLSLTTKGRLAFGTIDQRSEREVGALLGKLDPKDQTRVIEAMTTIEKVAATAIPAKRTYTLRSAPRGRHGLGGRANTACSIPPNMAGTAASRRSPPRSSPTS